MKPKKGDSVAVADLDEKMTAANVIAKELAPVAGVCIRTINNARKGMKVHPFIAECITEAIDNYEEFQHRGKNCRD
jgi:hypothetical protein